MGSGAGLPDVQAVYTMLLDSPSIPLVSLLVFLSLLAAGLASVLTASADAVRRAQVRARHYCLGAFKPLRACTARLAMTSPRADACLRVRRHHSDAQDLAYNGVGNGALSVRPGLGPADLSWS